MGDGEIDENGTLIIIIIKIYIKKKTQVRCYGFIPFFFLTPRRMLWLMFPVNDVACLYFYVGL